jgi:hypothetical protein
MIGWHYCRLRRALPSQTERAKLFSSTPGKVVGLSRPQGQRGRRRDRPDRRAAAGGNRHEGALHGRARAGGESATQGTVPGDDRSPGMGRA